MTRALRLGGIEIAPRQAIPVRAGDQPFTGYLPAGLGHAVPDEGWPAGYLGPAMSLCDEVVTVISDMPWIDLGPAQSCPRCALLASEWTVQQDDRG
ncbi:hypothetical protein GCU60_19595 [Blastococcus saxobsidens]|uniref:Uncharacterized protein n=1 Tax=Blastococcus saxobsidens TaxID=138336 RepID=A0A6L9W7B0_9ACTN|nr:hypothetical protein [Blastococcus saxobsidens]NEK87947.1 hypothetical protein [Blastococcus saxobsidens]